MEDVEDNSSEDRILQAFALALEGAPASSMGVTLIVGGAVVSGMLSSEAAYWTVLSAMYREKSIGFDQAFDGFALQASERLQDEEARAEDVQYVHLIDAVVLQGGHALPTEGRGLMRIRVSEVDGWSPIQLGVAEQQESLIARYLDLIQSLPARADD